MMEKQINWVAQDFVQGARAALDVLHADKPRAADLAALLDWVDEQALCRTWGTFINRFF
jgi:hypothetical protein